MDPIIAKLRKELAENIDPKTKETSQRFFKEQIQSYGVKVPTVHKLSRELFQELKHQPKTTIFSFCDTLWQSSIIEESFVACNWSYFIRKLYEPGDFEVFEKWIATYVNNWASCDTLCNHTVGSFLEMYPEYLSRLREFAKSDNRWVKRAAAVSLIVPVRKGLFHSEALDIADILLSDLDDLVQKGYGWMLKAVSDSNRKLVFDYVMRNKNSMPRTSLRYAIEKMPHDMKQLAMKK